MTGHIAALYRHPVKGFTPERLDTAQLAAGAAFPCDRLYVVENGPSGFDPEAPAYIPKRKFTVLAQIAEIARAHTAYVEADGVLHASADGQPPFSGRLTEAAGRDALASWLSGLLGGAAAGPLRVIPAPGAYRFMDHPKGDVSVVNLASVRDLEARIGRPVDPLRFRANIYVEGWPAWVENGWTGRDLMLGWARARVFAPIVRCAAINVDPATAERDLDLTKALFDNYGHMNCGIYVHVTDGGQLAPGDAATAPEDPAQ